MGKVGGFVDKKRVTTINSLKLEVEASNSKCHSYARSLNQDMYLLVHVLGCGIVTDN